jgi:hypothetical protein
VEAARTTPTAAARAATPTRARAIERAGAAVSAPNDAYPFA